MTILPYPFAVRCALIALLFFPGAALTAEERAGDFRLQLPLRVSGEGPWYRLSVDMPVQLAAHFADLRDLRVFNAAGEPLAHALTTTGARQEHHLTQHEVRMFPMYASDARGEPGIDVRIQRDAGGTLIEATSSDAATVPGGDTIRRGWLLDGSAIETPLERLALDWNDLDGFQRFSIEASDDLQHWRRWGDGQVARLQFDGERVAQQEVRLPGRKARYLKLTWLDPVEAPVLTSVRLLSGSTRQRPAPLIWSSLIAPIRDEDGTYFWELPRALPLERLRIPLVDDNRLLPVAVSARADPAHRWRRIAGGLLYRVAGQDGVIQQDELDLPGGTPVKQLRLTVDPKGGGFGKQLPQLAFAMRSTELVFLARGEGPYRLAVGNPHAGSAALPLTTLMPGSRDPDLDGLPMATVTDPPTNAVATPAGSSGPDWKRIGLWAVLLAGVLALVLMAWSLLNSREADKG